MKLTLRIASTILVFLAVLAMPSYSRLVSGALKVQRVELSGTHPTNTVAFFNESSNSFALVAPYNPSEEGAWDNNKLFIINTKNPKDAPVEVSLGACYYPTNVVCTAKDAYVRATAFNENGEPFEVIVYVQLHLEDGKPGASRPVVVEIPGINGEKTTSEAPTDMVLSLDGKYLFFTNGVCVYSYNLLEGYVYKVCIFSDNEYGPQSDISLAGFDEKTRTIAVSHNKTEIIDEVPTQTTVLRFYDVEEGGVLSIRKIVGSEEFKKGVILSPGSEVAISADDEGKPEFAYFALSDGSIGQLSLHREPYGDDLFGKIKQVGQFAALAQGDGDPGPRITKLDGSGQGLWVLKAGDVLLNIRRPAFGRPVRGGGIRRPAFARAQESPALFSGKLNGKRTKLIQTAVLTDPIFGDGIIGLVLQEGSKGVVTTQSGLVLSIGFGTDAEDGAVELLGEIGQAVDFFTVDEHGNFVVLSSAHEQEDETGELVMSPGSLTVAKRKAGKDSSVALSIAQMLSHSAPPLARVFTSIRRPCNLGR